MVSKVNAGQVKFSSWGRTRSPKNILSEHRAGTNAAGAALVLTTAGGAQTFTTENQRFLHVVVTAVNIVKRAWVVVLVFRN